MLGVAAITTLGDIIAITEILMEVGTLGLIGAGVAITALGGITVIITTLITAIIIARTIIIITITMVTQTRTTQIILAIEGAVIIPIAVIEDAATTPTTLLFVDEAT